MDILKNVFFTAMTFFRCKALNKILLKCVSMNNQEYKIRPETLNKNSNEPLFILRVFLEINAKVVVIMLMIHMLNYVFVMLLKI